MDVEGKGSKVNIFGSIFIVGWQETNQGEIPCNGLFSCS
ncbi:hypothetical protein ZEAMMB73_Zm00001d036691 [Zea mays]|uniref:Uncharacterized protein n=1 Tax=Zea mays TaxID=4577 RepID=A0A1D6LQH1_MAIZE|nr:hypothetical protein ZEAMMB73_Zm00001d036691 [Zea mays]AQK81734.1 hypothetical protein ZEAMMB73_Zm00001d036691 [Zea mays]